MGAQRVSRERVYEGKVISVDLDGVRLPNGRETSLEIVRHPGASAVVPVMDDGRVLLIRQYRWAAGGYLLEAPAGKLDPGEDPGACAARELEEETGFRARTVEKLASVWTTPGFTDELIHLYLARGLEPGRQRLDSDEVLEPCPMTWDEVDAAIADGSLCDAKTLCALFMARAAVGR